MLLKNILRSLYRKRVSVDVRNIHKVTTDGNGRSSEFFPYNRWVMPRLEPIAQKNTQGVRLGHFLCFPTERAANSWRMN